MVRTPDTSSAECDDLRDGERRPEVISIDPPRSTDLDDAFQAVRRAGGGWTVEVCIPDAASLIGPGSPCDEEARDRVMTRYGGDFIRRPMLPKAVSEALSLSPSADTPMIWVSIDLDRALEPEAVRMRRLVHRTSARLSYAQADRILTERGHPLHAALAETMALARDLHAGRRARTGAVFDAAGGVLTNEEGTLEAMTARTRHPSHMMVMEIMILTNRALAEHAARNGVPILYRNHRPADADSGHRTAVAQRLERLGGEGGRAARPAEEIIRSMQSRLGSADFGVESRGHWGLDLPHYAWFTSPLRRYCDMVNGRAMFHGIPDEDPESTARTIGRRTIEIRDEVSATHGDHVRWSLARQIERGDVRALDAHPLYRIVRACAEHRVRTALLEGQVRRRMTADTMTGKDAEAVFGIGRDILDEDFLQGVGGWIGSDEARTVLVARDMVERGMLPVLPRNARGPDPRGCLEAIASLLDFDPEDGLKPDPSTAPRHADHPDPKGRLLGMAQREKAEMQVRETFRSGPAHAMRFRATATWTRRGERFEATGEGLGIREAERRACIALLDAMGDRRVPAAKAVASANPKSILLELATAGSATVAFGPPSATGPAHAPSFVVEAVHESESDRRTAQGRGRSRKEAERNASIALLEMLGVAI